MTNPCAKCKAKKYCSDLCNKKKRQLNDLAEKKYQETGLYKYLEPQYDMNP